MKRKMLFVGTVIDETEDSVRVNFHGLTGYILWIPKTAISRPSKSHRAKRAR